MGAEAGTEYRVKPHGFGNWWHAGVLLVALTLVFGIFYGSYELGTAAILKWIWIVLLIAGFWSAVTVYAKSTYPGSITVFADRIELHNLLGPKRIRIDMIGPPTYVEGAYVWFGTSRDAPGYWGTVLRVNGPVARVILASPSWRGGVVPPALAQKIAALDR